MNMVFICSPYRGDKKKNLENAIEYCRRADTYNKIPIAPHVYFTRIFRIEDWRSRFTGMYWGKYLMQYCKEIWIFCNELTEGMIEEIAEAKKLGIDMKFFNLIQEEINNDNYLIHTEIGPAYRRLIAEYFGDRCYLERGCTECSTGRHDTGADPEDGKCDQQTEEAEYKEEGRGSRGGFFSRLFRRK